MKVLDRFKTALTLMKDSLLILRHNPTLMLFPIISGIAGIAFLAVFFGLSFGFGGLELGGDSAAFVPFLILLGILYLLLTFVSVFFTAALVHQTHAVLQGKSPSLEAGIRGAWALTSSHD